MVRAAGLYPAGSRFESWLPYHPTHPSAAARGRLPLAPPGAADRRSEQLADPFDDLVAPLGVQDRPRGRQRREPGRHLLGGDDRAASASGSTAGSLVTSAA